MKTIGSGYTFDRIVYDRYVIYYKDFKKRKGSKIGVYKILDLWKASRKYKFAFRYKPREGQTQEQSDNMILTNCIRNFYKRKIYLGTRGERDSIKL